LRKSGLFILSLVFVRPSPKQDYFRMMLAGSVEKRQETVSTELSIWDEQQQYTPAFIHLLKDYYLYL